ncbi:hypothetical protein BM1_07287 [Bipolaris maydis]|nr:hypothetical protein BM1_07287 [Bipolaris maydis]KAJ5023470.1 hypothetical protein J3E73DRAFT_399333 [Bipolaris maydis]KAJ6269323.1 hypothetical protein PSV08DRAFT_377984 [Bipolaris maydis]KAJ6280137.1 hypothetical protein J3E71DRAFT_368254 [Bipolaris maydis]
MQATILRLQRAGTLKVSSSNDKSKDEKESGVKRLFQRTSLRNGGRKKESEGRVGDNKDRNNGEYAETTLGAEQVTSNQAMREQKKQNQAPAADTNSAPQNRLASQASDPSQTKYSPVSGSLPAETPLDKVPTGNNEGLIKTDAGRSATSDSESVQENIEDGNKEEAEELVAENSSLLDKSIQHQQGPPEESASKKSEAINVDEPKPSFPITKASDIHGFLQAWTFSILPGLSSGFGASLGIVELTLLETEIRTLLQKQDAQKCSPLKTLHDLNSYQRHLILAHIDSRDAKLLHVDVWHKESIPTVFGQLDIETLIWITSSPEKREGPVDIEALFSEKEAIPSEPKEPINFKDAVGRKFTFPYHLIKSWKGMEELIKQAFLHVDVIGPHVHQGHYDLVGPDGQVILPQVWQALVQPGWNVTMHMWPMPEASQHAPPPGPPDSLRQPPSNPTSPTSSA